MRPAGLEASGAGQPHSMAAALPMHWAACLRAGHHKVTCWVRQSAEAGLGSRYLQVQIQRFPAAPTGFDVKCICHLAGCRLKALQLLPSPGMHWNSLPGCLSPPLACKTLRQVSPGAAGCTRDTGDQCLGSQPRTPLVLLRVQEGGRAAGGVANPRPNNKQRSEQAGVAGMTHPVQSFPQHHFPAPNQRRPAKGRCCISYFT